MDGVESKTSINARIFESACRGETERELQPSRESHQIGPSPTPHRDLEQRGFRILSKLRLGHAPLQRLWVWRANASVATCTPSSPIRHTHSLSPSSCSRTSSRLFDKGTTLHRQLNTTSKASHARIQRASDFLCILCRSTTSEETPSRFRLHECSQRLPTIIASQHRDRSWIRW